MVLKTNAGGKFVCFVPYSRTLVCFFQDACTPVEYHTNRRFDWVDLSSGASSCPGPSRPHSGKDCRD